jgi:hypothetical protein
MALAIGICECIVIYGKRKDKRGLLDGSWQRLIRQQYRAGKGYSTVTGDDFG